MRSPKHNALLITPNSTPRLSLRFYFAILSAVLVWQPLVSQTPIGILDFDCGNHRLTFTDFLLNRTASDKQEDCQRVKTMAMDALYRDNRLVIIAPEAIPAVEAERELQKDEDFLAGYVVEQWDQQGIEFLLTGQVITNRQELILQIHRIRDRAVITTHTQSFKVGLMAPYSKQRTLVEQGINILLSDFFNAKNPIVKVLNGGTKARRVLVAGGNNEGFRVHQELHVKVAGNTVGSVVVETVESDLFSQCRVISGGKEIAEALRSGQEVEVTIIKL